MKKLIMTLALLVVILTSGCISFTPVINILEITPNTITAGGSANLNWSVTGASSISINPGPGIVAAAGTITVNPVTTTAYTLTAQGLFGIASKSIVLIVNPAPIAIGFRADPALMQSGGAAILRWDVSGADSVSIDQGIGDVAPSGTQTVTPTQTITYTLTARNASGVVTRSTTITVNPPITASFSANPTIINRGQSSILTWNVTGASKVIIEPGIGEVQLSGSRTVNPSSSTSYTLTATTSCCAVTKAANVTVGTVYPDYIFRYPYDYYQYGGPYPYYPGYPGLTPFIEIFHVNPNHVASGTPALLSWNVIGATSITITGIGNVPPSGTRIIAPVVTTTYTLTASNAYGTSTRAVTVQVP